MRFEELQMRLMDVAKNYLDVYEMETFIEQYTLNKESRLSMSLPDLKEPYPITATVSFSYDVQQSSLSLNFEDIELDEDLKDLQDVVEIDVVISLPFLEGYNEIVDLFEDILREYSDLEPVVIKKETYRKDALPEESYEIAYSYVVDEGDLRNIQFYEEIFFELSNLLRSIYEKTKFYIDMTWYRDYEDDSF